MKIKNVFFDLDHTLWDFERNSALTFDLLFKNYDLKINLKDFLEVYVPINLEYWRLYRNEQITKEFLRFNIDFSLENIKCVDVQNIFHKMEKRTLGAAYKFYCEKELIDAHSSKADTLATFEVLEAQIKRYDDIESNVDFLSNFSSRNKSVDLAGFIIYDKNNIPCFSFGKHKGKSVDFIIENEPGYFGWLLNADFPMYTKKILTKLRLTKLNNKL